MSQTDTHRWLKEPELPAFRRVSFRRHPGAVHEQQEGDWILPGKVLKVVVRAAQGKDFPEKSNNELVYSEQSDNLRAAAKHLTQKLYYGEIISFSPRNTQTPLQAFKDEHIYFK